MPPGIGGGTAAALASVVEDPLRQTDSILEADVIIDDGGSGIGSVVGAYLYEAPLAPSPGQEPKWYVVDTADQLMAHLSGRAQAAVASNVVVRSQMILQVIDDDQLANAALKHAANHGAVDQSLSPGILGFTHPLRYRMAAQELKIALGDYRPENGNLARAYAAYNLPIIFLRASPRKGYPIDPVEERHWERWRKRDTPFLFFLDGSIWHRFADLEIGQIDAMVGEVARWQQEGRYRLYSALEYLDYSLRTLTELKVHDFDSNDSHGAHIHLGLPASESEHAARLSEAKPPRRRRFLVVDDHCCANESKMSSIGPVEHGKADYIRLNMRVALPGLIERDEDFECRPSLSEAQALLQGGAAGEHKIWDIILLDYLFRDPGARLVRYGTELLRNLVESKDDKTYASSLGPAGRHWVFTASSFPMAFPMDLLWARAPDGSHRLRVCSGPDPICTPYVFVHELLGFMREQEAAIDLSLAGIAAGIDDVTSPVADADTYAKLERELSRHREHMSRLWSSEAPKSVLVAGMVEDWAEREHLSGLHDANAFDSFMDAWLAYLRFVPTAGALDRRTVERALNCLREAVPNCNGNDKLAELVAGEFRKWEEALISRRGD